MIPNNRRRGEASWLGRLPGLPAEITVDGHPLLRGTVVEVRDGKVVVDVVRPASAAKVAAAVTAELTVHAPGLVFEATTAPVGTAVDGEVELRVGPRFDVRPRIA